MTGVDELGRWGDIVIQVVAGLSPLQLPGFFQPPPVALVGQQGATRPLGQVLPGLGVLGGRQPARAG